MDDLSVLQARVVAMEQRTQALEAELARLRHVLAHDLKAPLRHITGYAQVIEEDHGQGLDPVLAAHLKTITQAAAALREMIDGQML
jgi:light-regulated signal transduction histidine kinase (bacteriophytochrome)